MGWWTTFKEWLLPSRTFANSPTPENDLAYGRVLVFIFYVVLAGVFIYTTVKMFYSGQVEVITTGYKVDSIEAPSLVICPFFAETAIVRPVNETWLMASKMDLEGRHSIDAEPYSCTYDRECVCLDLRATRLIDGPSRHIGTDGHKSSLPVAFRERIEVLTNLMDPSVEMTLKIGMFDTVDKTPNWFYVGEGAYSIGQLEMQVWTVTDMSIKGLMRTLHGDWNAMAQARHIFRYTSQEVGSRGSARPWNQTALIYEMKNFFVDETISSETSFSFYTVCWWVTLIVMRTVVIDVFFSTMFPNWEEKRDGPKPRELSSLALQSQSFLCGLCCLPTLFASDEGSDRQPLLDPSP